MTPNLRSPLPFSTIFALSLSQASIAEVTFDLTFEPGSKWFTESDSDDARTAMTSFFSDLGKIFDTTASVSITITDNETSAYASTGSDWYDYVTLDGLSGEYYAPAAWVIINKGFDKNGPDSDVTVNWNMDVDALYSGDPNRLINNFRGRAGSSRTPPRLRRSFLFLTQHDL